MRAVCAAAPLCLLLAGLAGCAAAVGPLAAAGVISVTTVQRDPADVVVSAVTGLDCSIVRLGAGKTYCKPVEPPPLLPEYCTRSLGVVDCWAEPDPFGYYQREVADGPATLTWEQEWRRTAPWPFR